MIVKSYQFANNQDNYVKKNFFLFYGPNIGKVEDCCNHLVKTIRSFNDKYSVVNISQEEFTKENFYKIIKKYDDLDIFGKKNILVFSSIEIKSFKEFIYTLENHKFNYVYIIFKFNELTKRSEIRSFFEKSSDCVCVPCYEETVLEKKKIIVDFFKSENLEIRESDLANLTEKLSNQKLELLSELEKIVVFLKNNEKSLREYLENFDSTIFSNESEFIFELVSNNKKKFSNFLFNSSQFQNNEIKIINYLAEHFSKILQVKYKVRKGFLVDDAIKSLKPPIFFKYLAKFKGHINFWNEKEINEVLKKLYSCQNNFLEGLKTARYEFLFLVLKILNKDFKG